MIDRPQVVGGPYDNFNSYLEAFGQKSIFSKFPGNPSSPGAWFLEEEEVTSAPAAQSGVEGSGGDCRKNRLHIKNGSAQKQQKSTQPDDRPT